MTRTFVGTAGRDSRCAWACRNCRQIGPARRGAGPIPRHAGSPRRWTARPSRRVSSSRRGSGGIPTADSPSPGGQRGGRCWGPSAAGRACAGCSCRTSSRQAARTASGVTPAPGQHRRLRDGEDVGPAVAGYELGQRGEPHPVGRLVTHPVGVAAQHRVLVPDYQQLSILRHVLAERQDSEAEYPANQQVDDPDQHGASQPSPRQARWRWRRSPRNRVFERNTVDGARRGDAALGPPACAGAGSGPVAARPGHRGDPVRERGTWPGTCPRLALLWPHGLR